MSGGPSLVTPGERIGPFRVVEAFHGRGGMAQICEVKIRKKYQSPKYPKRLALKIADQKNQPALVAETDFLRRFNHKNVVKIYPLPGRDREVYAAREQFTGGWRWYYVMELLVGGSLEAHLTHPTKITHALVPPKTQEKPLSYAVVWGIVRQLTLALDHIHQNHVLNLDVKPANILFRKRKFEFLKSSVPEVVLSDFGISRDPRHPRFGILGVATPAYVSPEHAREALADSSNQPNRFASPDARSDIFSLGVVMYEMLTGELPFDENVVMRTMSGYGAIVKPPREVRKSVPEGLEAITMRALASDPSRRYQTAAEMQDALDQVGPFIDWKMHTRRLFAGVTLAAVAVTGAVGVPQVGDLLSENNTNNTPPTEITRPTKTPTEVTTSMPGLQDEGGEETLEPTDASPATSTPRPPSTATPPPLPPPPVPNPEG
jgi:serine/threonine protein kinase